jgi:hypothetical protein
MRKAKGLVIASVIVSLLCVNFVYCTHIPTIRTPNIVLISWDGVERTVFLELLNSGKLPTMARLNIYNMTDNREYRAATGTRPQHSIMLSGYLANVTLTISNNPYPVYWHPLENKSMFFRIKSVLPTYYIAGFVTYTKYVAPCLISRTPDPDENIAGVYLDINGFDHFESFSSFIHPLVLAHAVGTEQTVLRIAEAKPQFIYFFHWGDPDAYGHQFGVDSTEYREGIIQCDMLVGKLMSQLPSDTIFIVTSDHGFGTNGLKYSHGGCPNTFLASNVKLANAHECDIAPTIYALLSINSTRFDPPLAGKSLLEGE